MATREETSMMVARALRAGVGLERALL